MLSWLVGTAEDRPCTRPTAESRLLRLGRRLHHRRPLLDLTAHELLELSRCHRLGLGRIDLEVPTDVGPLPDLDYLAIEGTDDFPRQPRWPCQHVPGRGDHVRIAELPQRRQIRQRCK